MTVSFTGKVAIMTGGGFGTGGACAQEMVRFFDLGIRR